MTDWAVWMWTLKPSGNHGDLPVPTVWPSNFLMEQQSGGGSWLVGQITEACRKAELILAARSNGSQIATCLRDLPVSNWNVVINFLRRSDVTCCLCKGQENRGGLGRSWVGGSPMGSTIDVYSVDLFVEWRWCAQQDIVHPLQTNSLHCL